MDSTRRHFLKKALGTTLAGAALPQFLSARPGLELLQPQEIARKNFGPNDQVNIGIVGMGIMGFSNAYWSLQIPGVKLVGVCDLYTGRLDRAREQYGKDLFVTKNYQELLDRKDIDVIFVCTSDHWHDRITIEALNKGKHVYCEKPMVHKLEEGAAMLEAQKKSGKIVQVGSQRVSSIVTEKARQLFESGIIGELILVETKMDRHSANGAWQYSIPTDANNNTVDWDRFIGDAPKIAYDPVRFFRWRNYQDYGTGVAGDLFVHLFSALHAVTSSTGPTRAFATGGLRYWKDGRDVPDVILGLYDYAATKNHPAFNLQMRVNFVDGSEDGADDLRFIGTEGVLSMGWSAVKVQVNKLDKNPGYGGWDSYETFSAAQQKEFEKWYKAKHPDPRAEVKMQPMEYRAPDNYSANLDHHINFYAGIREGKPIKEDALFGMRAAGPALLANRSYFEKKVMNWDPENAKLL
jgi:predicted dehydrogenase